MKKAVLFRAVVAGGVALATGLAFIVRPMYEQFAPRQIVQVALVYTYLPGAPAEPEVEWSNVGYAALRQKLRDENLQGAFRIQQMGSLPCSSSGEFGSTMTASSDKTVPFPTGWQGPVWLHTISAVHTDVAGRANRQSLLVTAQIGSERRECTAEFVGGELQDRSPKSAVKYGEGGWSLPAGTHDWRRVCTIAPEKALPDSAAHPGAQIWVYAP